MSRRWPTITVLCFALAFPVAAQGWRDTYESRLEILALLQTLSADILAGSSATRSLEERCGAHVARGTLELAKDVFQHRAVLYAAEHLPFSEVVETYRSELLVFSRSR
jgi:hypothetical protein